MTFWFPKSKRSRLEDPKSCVLHCFICDWYIYIYIYINSRRSLFVHSLHEVIVTVVNPAPKKVCRNAWKFPSATLQSCWRWRHQKKLLTLRVGGFGRLERQTKHQSMIKAINSRRSLFVHSLHEVIVTVVNPAPKKVCRNAWKFPSATLQSCWRWRHQKKLLPIFSARLFLDKFVSLLGQQNVPNCRRYFRRSIGSGFLTEFREGTG